MYHDDHNPPHFHVMYNEYAGVVNIETGELLAGTLPPKVLSLVNEWREQNIKDIMQDWELATNMKPLKIIKPLV